ncbi:MAG: DUF2784 domain-containing protein [Desulfobacterales bacterium]
MFFRIAADMLVILHLGFIVFVVLGGFAGLKWRRLIYLHLPAAAWGALIVFKGWICPLTPLEIYLRRAGGQAGYSGSFIDHYLIPIIYPAALTRELQIAMGVMVVAINLLPYGWMMARYARKRKAAKR